MMAFRRVWLSIPFSSILCLIKEWKTRGLRAGGNIHVKPYSFAPSTGIESLNADMTCGRTIKAAGK